MHYDPDLSAVVTRRIEPLFQRPLQSVLSKRADLQHTSMLSSLNKSVDLESIDVTVKKRKLSDKESSLFSKNIELSSNNVSDVYSMLLGDAKRFEERVNINDSVLINTFTKAIFRFALHELSNESEQLSSHESGLSFFRPFASKHYGKVTCFEDIKWIWTLNESEGIWLTTCKKIYKEFSTRFFSNEKIMMKWIDNKLIKDVVQNIYTKYRDFFGQSLATPELFYYIVPILTANRF